MDSWVVPRKYQGNMAAGKGSHARQGGSAIVKGTMEMFLRGCTFFTLLHSWPGRGEGQRDLHYIFALCIFRYICTHIHMCACVCFGRKSFCLFPSEEGLIIPIQNTHLMGQDPW